jgi:hypothetical protein
MSPRARRRSRPWFRRLGIRTWLLLALLLLAGLSLLAGPWFRNHGTLHSGIPQVQVLNGSNVRGLAGRVAEHLREQGIDVVSVGNADSDQYAETLVLLRRGEMATAYRVAQALGSGTSLQQLDPTLLVDVTIILGADYEIPEGGVAPTDADDRATR